MRKAEIGTIQQITIGGRMINNLRYADDTTLITGNLSDLKILISTVQETSKKSRIEIKYKENKGDFKNSNWKMITSKLYTTSISWGQLFVTMQIVRKKFGEG